VTTPQPTPRVPLYRRLPEIYIIRDQALRDERAQDRGQLEAYLQLVESAFSAVHANIEGLYNDLFIETASDWVVPYIGDLLGTSHLSGDPWTLRADVADTIALRRRKGTLAAIELLTFDLTRWGVRCVELRENLVWLQHVNHQRPDAGGEPPYGQPGVTRFTPIRGGTVPVRDPAALSLLTTPFDPFGHIPDFRPAIAGTIRYNLPNLAIFLWRLSTYRIRISKPGTAVSQAVAALRPGEAPFVARFDVFQIDRRVMLFNLRRLNTVRRLNADQASSLTEKDEAPGPVERARLMNDPPAGNSGAYVSVHPYDIAHSPDPTTIADEALQLHVPDVQFPDGTPWTFRGANLCAWDPGLKQPIHDREIVIDPVIGRIVAGVASLAEADALRDHLLLTFTYGAVGEVGSNPGTPTPDALVVTAPFTLRAVRQDVSANDLRDKLNGLDVAGQAIIVEIQDSKVHDLDLSTVAGIVNEDGGPNLQLNHQLVIRAAADCRPVVRLRQPLRFRSVDPTKADFGVRLEGLYITRGSGFPANEPLVARAALDNLTLQNCTLDPARFHNRDGTVAGPIQTSIALTRGHGFLPAAGFAETPAVNITRCLSGPLLIDDDSTLEITDSIVDGGAGVTDNAGNAYALSSATDPVNNWGPPATTTNVTFFGRVRVENTDARGCIYVHALEVHNNQTGCIKLSYFSNESNRLPQNSACVSGADAGLHFVSDVFGDASYGQLALTSDFHVLERGPHDDQMGAYGFLQEAHKWHNLQTRFREFMPLGTRPLLIPVS
jgi:hypothetical protein